MKQPRILLCNDDGIGAPGLQVLANVLEPLGELWVVAPDRNQSGTSHSISLHHPLRIHPRGERRFSVDGTPTDCVYLALHHVLPGRPDIVLSGINDGPNLGTDVIYSGTVSAAMEAALFGYSAAAVSLVVKHDRDGGRYHFESAARVIAGLLQGILDEPMPPGVLLNVNVPNVPFEELRGNKLCRLGFNDWAQSVSAREDPRRQPYYWIGGTRSDSDVVEGSDVNAVAEKFVAMTPVHYDLTDYRSFDYVRRLKLDGLTRAEDTLGNEPLTHPVHPRFARG